MQRLQRLVGFAAVCGVTTYALVNAGLAWSYVHSLTHPGCAPEPQFLAGVPYPIELFLPTNEGHLRSWYYPGQEPLAVIALGGQAGALGERLPPVRFLIEAGYPVLQIDSRACMQPAQLVTLGAQEALDAAAGLDFLLAQPGIENAAVFGFSMGGAAAIRLAAYDPRLAAVVAEGGYDNLGRDFIEPETPAHPGLRLLLLAAAGSFWAQSGFNPWEISPVDDLPALHPRPVLLIYGEYELEHGHGDRQFAAARQPKELWVVPGGDHGTNYQAAPEMYRRQVLSFLQGIK
jgi:uncharacterized protein